MEQYFFLLRKFRVPKLLMKSVWATHSEFVPNCTVRFCYFSVLSVCISTGPPCNKLQKLIKSKICVRGNPMRTTLEEDRATSYSHPTF